MAAAARVEGHVVVDAVLVVGVTAIVCVVRVVVRVAVGVHDVLVVAVVCVVAVVDIVRAISGLRAKSVDNSSFLLKLLPQATFQELRSVLVRIEDGLDGPTNLAATVWHVCRRDWKTSELLDSLLGFSESVWGGLVPPKTLKN